MSTDKIVKLDSAKMPFTVEGVDISTFSDKQRAFLAAKAEGLTDLEAVTVAGYRNPGATIISIRQNNELNQVLNQITVNVLREGAELGAVLLRSQARDTTLNPKIRQDAAKTLLDRAGFLPPSRGSDDKSVKSPSEMDTEELRRFIDEGAKTLSDRAVTVVDGAIDSQQTRQPTDFLD